MHSTSSEKTLRLLLPEHRLRNLKSKEQASLVSNIIQEHKVISSKGAKGITVRTLSSTHDQSVVAPVAAPAVAASICALVASRRHRRRHRRRRPAPLSTLANNAPVAFQELQYQFLSFCWNLCVYGATFFDALVFMSRVRIECIRRKSITFPLYFDLYFQPMKGDLHVHVGVNDYGLHLINTQNKTLFQTYPLKGIEWTHKPDHPYLEVRVKQPGQLSISAHVLTVKTRQVCFFITSIITPSILLY